MSTDKTGLHALPRRSIDTVATEEEKEKKNECFLHIQSV